MMVDKMGVYIFKKSTKCMTS